MPRVENSVSDMSGGNDLGTDQLYRKVTNRGERKEVKLTTRQSGKSKSCKHGVNKRQSKQELNLRKKQ